MKVILFLILFLGVANADSLKIASTSQNIDYQETNKNGSFLDSEKRSSNAITGVSLGYVKVMGAGHGGATKSSLEFDFDYSKGDSFYNGSLQSSTSATLIPFQSTTKNTIIDSKIGWNETKKTEAYDVGVFTSIGYRYWQRDLGSQYGYIEEYKWLYADLGLKTIFHDGDWHIGFEVAHQRAYQPVLDAKTNGGLHFNLGNTSGYYYKIPLSYDINKNYSIKLSYKVNHWEIGASDVNQGYYEPQSVTNNSKITIGLVIKW